MKNRKTVIIAFLLVAALLLGIGYAAYSTKLFINGTAEVESEAIAFTNEVVFTNAKTDNASYGTVAFTPSTATFDVFGMTQKDQRVHLTYTITNNSDSDVVVKLTTKPTTTATNSKFVVTQDVNSDKMIVAGGTLDVVITVVLNENVTEKLDPVSYTVEYTATSIDTAP